MLADAISNIGKEINSSRLDTGQLPDFSYTLAETLQWTEGRAQVKQIELGQAQFSKGLIGYQPAAIFTANVNSISNSLLNYAAFYAYHAAIPWGLIATKEGTTIFNSHWLRNNEWFHLPLIRWDEVDKNIDLLEALTPSGLEQGQIERLATSTYKPDKLLYSVDDALVDRLDYWRSEALRYSQNSDKIDESLQTLFAQLFVLRVVEDKSLAPLLPPLSSVSNAQGKVDTTSLNKIFQNARDVIGSELFEIETLQDLPEQVLGGIINDLYTPYNLPQKQLRYNFSWIDVDVLGRAYEKYLSTVLSPIPLSGQLSLFDQPVREVERLSVRKSSGVYYTPSYLVDYLVESSLDNFQKDNPNQDHVPRIADFACGSGSFLVAAANSLIRRLRERDPNKNWAHELVSGKHLIGIDIDERAVIMARLALWIRFTQEPQPLPLPRLEQIIIHGDSLGEEVWKKLPDSYDIILGNPPFIATGRTPNREQLVARFRTAQGRFDYSYLFVELALKYLVNNGILGMVIPNRLFKNKDASLIREVLTSETNLITLIDFGANEVFEGISAYIGCIVAEKQVSGELDMAANVRVIHVTDLTPQFIGTLLLEASSSNSEILDKVIIAYSVPHPRGSGPWLLLSPSARRARNRVENNSRPLSELAGIYQGIRTGANDIFIFQIDSASDGPLVRVINGLGDNALIESALLHPAVFGGSIQRYEVIKTDSYLLFPYRNDSVVPEVELQKDYPRTYEYLLRYKDLLADRSSIEASGLRWYELVRKRDITWLNSPKLLIRDLATSTSFAVDTTGATYLIGGTAIVPANPEDLFALLAYLNSKLVNQYLSQITPLFKRGFQKFEPQHLQRVPVLNDLYSGTGLHEKLTELAHRVLEAKLSNLEEEQTKVETEIDRIIYEAAGIREKDLV
jgi:type I restriction-modification system DNA methylase subunit